MQRGHTVGYVAALLTCAAATALQAQPTRLVCEWRAENAAVGDSHPEFLWKEDAQVACQVQVAASEDALEGACLWDSGRLETLLPIIEYAGAELADEASYVWRVRTWEAAGGDPGPWSEMAHFTMRPEPLPSVRPHVRCFVNFGSGDMELMARRYDVSFRAEPNELRPEYIALRYCLMATMVIPSGKYEDLLAWCVEEGLAEGAVPEEMFVHYAQDTPVTLHVGAEKAENPRETRTVPGWDAANDRNGDGVVDDAEAADPANPQATARRMSEARIPMYYWGPPRDDYVMNVGHREYQRYLAEQYMPEMLAGGYDGFFVDTTRATVPGAHGAEIVEYPSNDPQRWMRDMQMAMARVKIALPDSVMIANGWHATPFVLDGMEDEGWLNITTGLAGVEAKLRAAVELDRRGKIQLLQYNPIYEPERAAFGPKVPVSLDRDAIYGLAAYYLCAGEHTYYGYGRHPYGYSTTWYTPAVDYDTGTPVGGYEEVVIGESLDAGGENLLPNGDFEADADGDGLPDEWEVASPLVFDEEVRHSGKRSVRVDSDSVTTNNFSKGWVDLQPNTTYTLTGWMKTEAIEGGQGAQIYPYEFDGAEGGGINIIMRGTNDWTPVSQVFRTGDDGHGRINFRVYGSTGVAWFDGLRLVEGAVAPQVLLERRFTNARVILRPAVPALGWGDETAIEYALGANHRPLQADGTLGEPTDTARLRPGEAMILMGPE